MTINEFDDYIRYLARAFRPMTIKFMDDTGKQYDHFSTEYKAREGTIILRLYGGDTHGTKES